MSRTTERHLDAIERALEVIEEGLRGPLDLDQAARDSGMSYWHFQRTFSALVGEPVGSYVRRRRIAAAARELLHTRRRILEIALDYGFESHAAFTRAFRARVGKSPDAFRRDPVPLWSARPLTGERLRRLQSSRPEPAIIELPTLHLLGRRTRFIGTHSERSNSTTVLPRLWRECLPRLRELEGSAPRECYGAWDSLPRAERTDPDELQYLAAIPIVTAAPPPPDLVVWSVRAGRFARFVHRGPVNGIADTIDFIYGVWLPSAGMERGPGCDLERYDARFSATSEQSEFEYYVPLAG